MENEIKDNSKDKLKEPRTYLNYGIIIGLILIVLFVVYYVFALYTDKALAWIPTLVFLVLIVAAQINHAKAMKGDITYGNLFAAGFKTACASIAIYVIFLILFSVFVPSYKDQMMEVSRQAMVKKGLSADQINAGMAIGRRFFTVSLIGGTIVIELIFGVIASLIGAAIAKKNPQAQNSLV